ELAQVPLLLGLICLVYEALNEVPQEKHELYEEMVAALLGEWDAKRKIQRDVVEQKLSEHVKSILAYVAAKAFEKGEYLLKKRVVVRLINEYLNDVPGLENSSAEKILQFIETQHGLIVEQAHNIYSFSHLTLQEYFVARYIVDNEHCGSVAWLTQFVEDNRWDETFLLTAGMLDDSTEFCEFYLKAVSELFVGDIQLVNMLHWAIEKTTCLPLPYKAAAVRAILIYRGTASINNINFTHYNDLFHNLYIFNNLPGIFDGVLDLELVVENDSIPVFDKLLTLARACDTALTLALALDPALSLAFESALNLGIALYVVRYFDKSHAFDNSLAHVRNCALTHSRTLGLDKLSKDLELLEQPVKLDLFEVPEGNPKQKLWHAFSKKLDTIIVALWDQWDINRNISIEDDEVAPWTDLSKEQVDKLIRYLEANNLLVRCLQVAYVPDWQAIEDQILLPPSA
ncbi:MAG: hypothetical protein DWQ04_20640, partial [Chloroflexi bacterium]